jgi:hypothetical protein
MAATKNIEERTRGWYSLAPSPDKMAIFLSTQMFASEDMPSAATSAAPRRLVLQLNAEAGETQAHLAWASLCSKLLQGPCEQGTWCSLLSVGAQQLSVLVQAELDACTRQGHNVQEEETEPTRCTPKHEERVRRARDELARVAEFAKRESAAFAACERRTMPKEAERVVRDLLDAEFPFPASAETTIGRVEIRQELQTRRTNWLRRLQTAFPGDITLQTQGLYEFDVYHGLRARYNELRLWQEAHAYGLSPSEASSLDMQRQEEQVTQSLHGLLMIMRVYGFLLYV